LLQILHRIVKEVVDMSYELKHQKPTAAQWMALRESVGWAVFANDVAEKSLAVTPFCVCAFDGDKLIGMGRVLGDGVISFYIGNVIVLPDWQGKGVGSAIINEIMAHVREVAVPGAIASLMSVKGKESFYEKVGFVQRPDEQRGSGMSIYF